MIQTVTRFASLQERGTLPSVQGGYQGKTSPARLVIQILSCEQTVQIVMSCEQTAIFDKELIIFEQAVQVVMKPALS